MSKRELKQRLDELFSAQAESSQAEPSAPLSAPPAPMAPDRQPELTDERLQAIALESAADGIVIADRHGHALWVNPAFTRMTGYAPEEVVGQNLRLLKSGQHDRAFYENLWSTILSGRVWRGEVVNRRKDGSLYHENQIITPVRDERGEIAYFVSTKQDITERKQAEDALRQSEEKYRNILENINEGYYEVDLTGSFTFFNDSMCRILGYPKEELMGMNDRQYTDKENAKKLFEAFNQVYRTGEAGRECDYEITRKDGTKRYVEASLSLRKDSSGKPIGFGGIVRDIMERKQAEENIARRNQQLAVLNQASRQLNKLTDLSEICELIYTFVGQLIDHRNFYIALHDEARQEISFPIYTLDGERREVASRPFASGLTEYLLGTKAPVLFKRDVEAELEKLGIASIGRKARCWLGVPMVVGDKPIGVIALQDYDREAVYTEEHVELLATLAAQAATAIENARLFGQAHIRAEEMAALNRLARTLAARLSVDQVLDEIHRGVSQLLDTKNFYIGLYNPDKNEISFPMNVTESAIDREIVTISADQGITGHVIRSREALLIQDDVQGWLEKMGMNAVGEIARSWLGVPLMIGDQVLGVMAVQSYTDSHAYDAHDQELMDAFAGQAAIAIQNARLFEDARQRTAELATLNQIISSASQTLDLRALLDQVLRQTLEVFGFDGGLITMYNETRHKLERIVRTGLPGGIPDDPAEGLENSLCAYVFNSKEALVIEDFLQGAPIDVSGEIEAGYYSYIGVPLEAKGRMLGTWCGFRKFAGPFGKNTLALLQAVGHQAGFAIENARLFEEGQRRIDELAILNEIGREFSSALSLDELFVAAHRQVGRVLDATNFFFVTYEEGAQEWTMAYHSEGGQLLETGLHPLGVGLTSHILLSRKPLLLRSLQESQSFTSSHTAQRTGRQCRSWMGVPLIAAGRVAGAMVIQNYEQDDVYDEQDLTLFSTIASQAAIALQNARLFEQTQRDAQRERTIAAISERIYSTTDVKDLLRITAEELRRATGSARAVVKLGRVGLPPDGTTIQPAASDEGVMP